MRYLIFIIIVLGTFVSSLGQNVKKIEIPSTNFKDTIIYHTHYSLSFNQHHKQANWVAYLLTQKELIKSVERNDKFTADPFIPNTNFKLDYKKSGFDRGHLAPAGDMFFSETSMKESFYFSNISPQTPSFNRGIWNHLEENIRAWVMKNDSIYIVVGPIFSDSLKTIGPNKISVPNFYFKALLDNRKNHQKSIAFIIPNEGSTEPLGTYAISIDELEIKTGFDFFYLLPDSTEKMIESQFCYECWTK